MKAKIFLSLLILSTAVMAETNWDQLIKEAESATTKTGVIVKDFQEIRVVELKGGKLRFDGFTSMIDKNRMKLIVETDRTLKETCLSFVERGNKFKFKARLVFNKGPIDSEFSFVLDEKVRSSREFENPVVIGKTEMRELNPTDSTPFMDRSLESLGVDVSALYLNLMNNAINSSTESQVVVDLSKHNGLACDIGMGFIRPTLVKTVSFDRALPESVSWISESTLTDLYKTFNEELEKSAKLKDIEAQKFNEAFILGWSIAQVKSNLKEVIFSKSERAQKLLRTLKIKTEDRESNTVLWRLLSDYEKPAKTLTTQRMPVAVGAVEVKLED